MDERLEEIKIFEAMKETILKKEPDEDKQWLINRVEELKDENQELKEAGKFFADGYHQYEEENQRYKEALEFYANPQIWKEGKLITDNRYEMPLVYNDNGEKAQQALKGSGEYKN